MPRSRSLNIWAIIVNLGKKGEVSRIEVYYFFRKFSLIESIFQTYTSSMTGYDFLYQLNRWPGMK